MPVCRFLSRLVALAVLAVATLATIFLVGMRTNSAPIVGRVRQFNKAVSNPQMMKSAGTPGSTTSIIRHVGRSSGTPYETPIGAVATDDGFLIGLPYGLDADWMKNVLAAGSATVVKDGVEHEVRDPEVVPTAEVIHEFGSNDRSAFRLFNVENCLRVRHATPETSTS